jgi:outer membrane lipoprotein carrier protein
VEPYEQWLLADGLNVWSYDLDLAQVTVKPQARALANTPALLLGGSADALEQFDYQGSYKETVTTWVRLAPKNTESGFMRVELGFIEDTLNRMVFFDNLEQTTLVEFRDVAVNEPIDPARFKFNVPDNVDVVGMPAAAETTAP